MNINIELAKGGFKWIINFNYNVGNCLVDAIAYLETSKEIQENSMFHFLKKLNLGTLEVMEYHRKELNFFFLHNLHNGEVNDEEWCQCQHLMVDYGGISLQYSRYHNIYNVRFIFGTKLVGK